jgi:hypothetical protein
VRIFESFNDPIIIDLLTDIKENDGEEIIRRKVIRSLNIMEHRKE